MKLYKNIFELIGTLIIVALFLSAFVIPNLQSVTQIFSVLGLLFLIVGTPLILKRNSNYPRKKVLLALAILYVGAIASLLTQVFSFGPFIMLIAFAVEIILLIIFMRIKTPTITEKVEANKL